MLTSLKNSRVGGLVCWKMETVQKVLFWKLPTLRASGHATVHAISRLFQQQEMLRKEQTL